MSRAWVDSLGPLLERIAVAAHDLTDDVEAGARVIFEDSQERVPKETGDLASSGHIRRERGGDNTVAITYDSVYARYQHEHLFFRHPTGGQAKFLETAMLTKGEEAINKAGEHFWGRL